MGIIIEDIRTYSPLTGTDETSFLVDNQSDVVTVEIDFRIENYIMPTSEVSTALPLYYVQLGAQSANTGMIFDDKVIVTNNPEGFLNFKVGDTFEVVGATTGANDGTGLITEILAPNIIKTDKTFGTTEQLPTGVGYIAITTPITAVNFKHGIIENTEEVNYLSKVDGSEQVAQIGGLSSSNTSYQTAELLGNKSWQFGSVQVKGNNQGLGVNAIVSQAFTIKHETIINPLSLFDQFDDIKNDIKPDWLLDGNSLRYVFAVDASPVVNNPNDITSGTFAEFEGNVGWYGETFNGGATNYSFSNLVYERLDTTVNTALELGTTETKITFTVNNTTDTPFSDTNTKAIFAIHFAPSVESQYRTVASATTKSMEHNYIYDDVISTLGAASGTPKQDGTDLQVIKSLTTTFVSSSEITVDVRIEMATAVANRIAGFSTQQYVMKFSVADHTLTRANSDKVALKLDATNYFIDTTDPTMISIAATFMEHPFSVIGTDDKTIITARTEDDIVGISSFTLDKNTRETDTIILTSATAQIIARKDANTFDVLDGYTTSLSNLELINNDTYGPIPYVDITQDRGFKTPADSLRQNVRLKRRTDLDAAGVFSYELRLPFILRWEDWQARANANSDLFDDTEQSNGLNHQWPRISATSGWNLYYRTVIRATKNGAVQTYTEESIISVVDYENGTEWDTEEIKSFDPNSDPILNGSQYGILRYQDTTIQGNQTFIGITPPVIGDLVVVLKANVFEKGNFKEQFTISTAYPAHVNTWFKSITLSNPSGDIWRGTADLDKNKIPDELSIRTSCRIYDKRVISKAKNIVGGGVKEIVGGGIKNVV